MNRTVIGILFYAALAAGPTIALPAGQAQYNPKLDPSEIVFGFDKLHRFSLTMSAQEWDAMQPVMPRGFPGPPGRLSRQERPAVPSVSDNRPTHRGNMVEFPIAYANLAEDGKVYTNIAVRYKGNFTYMASAQVLKRSLKIDFEKPGKDSPSFHGLGKINLHAGVLDPTRQREALSYAFFRAAGVPTPRTAFVELTLIVPGKYDQEYVGLYVAVEQVDRRFLRKWFANDQGLLMKPEGVRGPEYLGENWEDYENRYCPNRIPTGEEIKRVIAFARLVTNTDDEQFRHQINDYLDVDEFLRFLAANAILVNLDSPLAMPQNFYLYEH